MASYVACEYTSYWIIHIPGVCPSTPIGTYILHMVIQSKTPMWHFCWYRSGCDDGCGVVAFWGLQNYLVNNTPKPIFAFALWALPNYVCTIHSKRVWVPKNILCHYQMTLNDLHSTFWVLAKTNKSWHQWYQGPFFGKLHDWSVPCLESTFLRPWECANFQNGKKIKTKLCLEDKRKEGLSFVWVVRKGT